MSNEQDGQALPRPGAPSNPPLMATGLSVELPTRLDVDCVTRLYQLLSPLASHNVPVTVNAAKVTHVHAAALRVLAAFFRVRSAAGETTALFNPSEALRSGARHARLSAELGLTART